jgi:hypothetical protein
VLVEEDYVIVPQGPRCIFVSIVGIFHEDPYCPKNLYKSLGGNLEKIYVHICSNLISKPNQNIDDRNDNRKSIA